MTTVPCAVLVVAKAPIPGLAKTRLALDVGPVVAASIAAAALLDTLDAVRSLDVVARVVATDRRPRPRRPRRGVGRDAA